MIFIGDPFLLTQGLRILRKATSRVRNTLYDFLLTEEVQQQKVVSVTEGVMKWFCYVCVPVTFVMSCHYSWARADNLHYDLCL